MIEHPAFKTHLQVELFPEEGVLILSEGEVVALYGPVYSQLAQLLDGKRSADEIASLLSSRVEPAKVYLALISMEERGLLFEGMQTNIEQSVFWHSLGADLKNVEARLSANRVKVIGIGNVDSSIMLKELSHSGIQCVEDDTSNLMVVITDNYMRKELEEINRTARLKGLNWLLLRPLGLEPWLGPFFVAAQSGCVLCLQHKLKRHRLAYEFVQRHGDSRRGHIAPQAHLSASVRAVCQLATIEIMKILVGLQSPLERTVVSFDLKGLATRSHMLITNPACLICGTETVRMQEPVIFHPIERDIMAGASNTTPVEVTLASFEHLISPITGVVAHLTAAADCSAATPIYIAAHNAPHSIGSLRNLRIGLRNASAGKGATASQARVGALCEAIERYSAELHGSEYRVNAMMADFGDNAIHPNSIMCFSENQYRDRASWNANRSFFNCVPEPFDRDEYIDWTAIWSLTRERHVYIPTGLLYYPSATPDQQTKRSCIACSNGMAAGNSLEEAALNALLELVERDSVAIWWYNRTIRGEVNVGSFKNAWLSDLEEHHRKLDREVWAIDVTNDLNIPVFVACSRRRNGPTEEIVFGFGCHLDAGIALQRAFAEMNQTLCTAERLLSAGPHALDDQEMISWLRTAKLAEHLYLKSQPASAYKTHPDYRQLNTGNITRDFLLCKERIEALGMEVLLLDYTRSDIGMPVVRVIVPGMRHFWARLGPGRLYQVPTQMGWQKEPLLEEQLNPVPMFL
jgi:bacteriocin biosynthesis cyclodehydratase domain-containing protein